MDSVPQRFLPGFRSSESVVAAAEVTVGQNIADLQNLMPQKQNIVPLIFLDGRQSQAFSTGNNAAWHCDCGRQFPLVGRSGTLKGVSIRTRIDCPDCSRRFFVVPRGKDRGAVCEV